MRFVLASQSPARLRTLQAAGVRPEVVVSGVDEDAITAEAQAAGVDTGELVRRLAAAKASAVADTLTGEVLVLGCDSMLDLDGIALGKPGDAAAAAARWREMRGRTGRLYTGHCLHDRGRGQTALSSVWTTVRFAEVSEEEIELYCATGEPSRVAGAFTVDGLGGWFAEVVEGDHHNVVGLSLPELRRLLLRLGRTVRDLGYPAG